MDKKLAQKTAHHKWYLKNKEKVINDKREWRKSNPEKYKIQWQKANKNVSKNKRKEQNKRNREKYKLLKPYLFHYKSAKERCNNPNNDSYKYYGGKGIKFLLTMKEIRTLWMRDKANNMEKPSIDRKDSNKHYEFNNCRFMELSDNVKRRFNNE